MVRHDEPDRAAIGLGRRRVEDVRGERGNHYRITGQKIFITSGAENLVHLVLARTPGSPSGTRGIPLFLVPK